MSKNNIDRFLRPQSEHYQTALTEIKKGRKSTHWMWFIFPQIQGLGYSEMARYYALSNLTEAKDYLANPILRKNLIEITQALLTLENKSAMDIFGSPDDKKLHSSLTLFSIADSSEPLFAKVLDRYFSGRLDSLTVEILNRK